jgi:hypothetical protein
LNDAQIQNLPGRDCRSCRYLTLRRGVLDLSIIQWPFSITKCQTLVIRFATFSSQYGAGAHQRRQGTHLGGRRGHGSWHGNIAHQGATPASHGSGVAAHPAAGRRSTRVPLRACVRRQLARRLHKKVTRTESVSTEISSVVTTAAAGGGSSSRAPQAYGDAKVANRHVGVWHGATEKGP